MLCGQQGHNVLIVGTIAYMVIYEQVRIETSEEVFKACGFGSIGFDEITVQVQVFRIATKAIALGTVLIDTADAAPVKCTCYIVYR